MSVSLIVLRRREPNAPRPYRAWGYPWTTEAAIFIAVVLIVGFALNDQCNGMIALAILLASYPTYRGTRLLFQRKRCSLDEPGHASLGARYDDGVPEQSPRTAAETPRVNCESEMLLWCTNTFCLETKV